MKTVSILVVLALVTLLLSGCGESHAQAHAPAEAAPAASYKEGRGVQLTEAGRRFVGLRTAEVQLQTLNGREVTVVPSAAVLRSIRGDFVYVANGDWFLRTLVVLGVSNGEHTEIKEGLYEGDSVVSHGVRALSLAEIQALNGGVGCADGH